MLHTAARSPVEGVRKVGSLVPSCHPQPNQRTSGRDTGPLGGRPPTSHVLVLGRVWTLQPGLNPQLGNLGCFRLPLAPSSEPSTGPKRSTPLVRRLNTVLGDATADLVDGRPPGGPGSSLISVTVRQGVMILREIRFITISSFRPTSPGPRARSGGCSC